MRLIAPILIALCGILSGLQAQDIATQARELENKGDSRAARLLLQRSAQNASGDARALLTYAEFLDRHGDPGARQAYDKVLSSFPRGVNERRAAIARRLVILDLLAGDRESARRRLQEYRTAGGTGLDAPLPDGKPAALTYIEIPGPLRSFARMAALSPDL